MDLRRSAISGVRWTSTTTAYTLALQFAQVAVLAQCLDRASFGLVGMVIVTVGFASAFADLGLTQAIVQRQDAEDDGRLSTLFWVVLAVGTALSGLFYGLAGSIAAVMLPASGSLIDVGAGAGSSSADLADLLHGVAPMFLAGAMGHVPAALHQRELMFGRVTVIEAAAQTAGSVVTIALALTGRGPASIVYGLVVGAGARSVLMMGSAYPWWRPGLRIRRRDAAGFVPFGLYQTGERAVNFLAANIDYVIVGHVLGTEALGLYYAAYQVVIMPIQKMSPVLTRVAFPVFSRAQHDDAILRRGYVSIARLIGLVGFPALVGMTVTAPLFIPLVLGAQWTAAAPLAQLLVPVGLCKSLGTPLGSIFLAKGRADLGLKWNAVLAVVHACLFYAVASRGPHAVALAYGVSSGCALIAGQVLLRRLIGLGVGDYLAVLARPLFMSAVMGIVLSLAQIGVTGAGASPIHLLLFLVTLGGSVYFLLAMKIERDLLDEIRTWVVGDRA